MLKVLSFNIPLAKDFKNMSGYAMIMKDIVTKKRTVSAEPAINMHHYSILFSQSLVENKEDPVHSLYHVILGPYT